MIRQRKLLVGAAALMLILTVFSAYALSKTEIKVEGCDMKVTVKMAFFGPGASKARIDGWLAKAKELWNGPNKYQTFGDCNCKVTFEFLSKRVANRGACPAGYHCIYVRNAPVGMPSPPTFIGMRNSKPGEGYMTEPFEGSVVGVFDNLDTGPVIAHEIGHLLGLDDEYFKMKVTMTVNADGTATIHKKGLAYPPKLPWNSEFDKIAEGIAKKIAASGRVPTGRRITFRTGGPQPGKDPQGLMAQGKKPWRVLQEYINKIMNGNNKKCPDHCCCGNGVIEAAKGEQCDWNKTPTGCPPNVPCDRKCKCAPQDKITTSSSTSTTLTEGPGGGGTGEEGGGITTGGGGITDGGEPTESTTPTTTTIKPKCNTNSDCGDVTTRRICKDGDVYEVKTSPRCRSPGTESANCISSVKNTKADDCGEKRCVGGICVDDTTPTTIPSYGGCCDCAPPYGCASGPSIDDGDCDMACQPYHGFYVGNAICDMVTGNCVVVTTTSTTSTTVDDVIVTTTTVPQASCEDQGMHSSQSACNSACTSPSYCVFDEGSDCWFCKQVTVTCSGDLHSSSDCNGQCDTGKGESCVQYQTSPCYYCYCGKPDLEVSNLSVHVSKSASTKCVNSVCTTTCTVSADASMKVQNIGKAASGSSTASITLNPGMGVKTASVGSLNVGQVSASIPLAFSKTATVSGEGSAACSSLEWWSGTYTATGKADHSGSVLECDETNNEKSLHLRPADLSSSSALSNT